MQLKAKDYLSRPVRLPHWLRLLLILGLVCLAGSAFMALKDLDRERMNLEQLYIQKGESLIRSLSVGLRRDWIIEKSQQDMATFIAIDQSSDVMFLATSDYQGRLRGASMTEEALGEGTLGVPDPPEAFHPQWTPHFKTVTLPDGQRAFVVYRPLLYSLEPAPKTPSHHVKEPKAPPVWPPEDLDFAHPQRAQYCWVGFEMGPFEKAVAAGHRNAMIFSLLIGLVLSSVLLAVSWSLKFMRNYAVTNEIITRLPIGLILNNPQGQVILANQAAQRLAEIPESGFLGRTLGELTHGVFPDDKELTAHEMDISFREGRSLRLSVTCGTITGPGGVGLGRIVLMADLGELNRLKEALSKQEHLARLGGIASGLAHEIRNPLGAIKGLTQHLINKTSGSDEKEALQVILNSVERMARTITDFQSFANPAINAQRVELTELLARIHDDVRGRNGPGGVAMELNLPGRRLSVKADPDQLAEALDNLYQNAIQAMEHNQAIRPGLLRVSLIPTGTTQAIISFSDNGPGFGLDQLKTPFVPYFSSKAQNTGLGLAKANTVVQACKGSVRLANNPDGGALVTVTLPLEYDGLAELRLTGLDLSKFLREIHSFISYDARFNGVSLSLDVPPWKGPSIQGDRNLLTQALTNIYLNAIQATENNPAGRPGQLSVTLAGRDRPEGKVPGSLAIVFADNGPGFDQAQLDKPFVPFFTTKSKGMGLGMSIIRHIIEAHGGEVRLENRPEGGGQVTVILPVETGPQPSATSTTQTTAPGNRDGNTGQWT